jgi:pyrroline-5-carboxylate reductase
MTTSSLDFLSKETIGIIGCGHLGRAIALELVSRGFSSDRLRLSLGRSRRSLQNIVDCGLHHCLARNDEICRDCSIIFITIPPQSLPKLRGLSFP